MSRYIDAEELTERLKGQIWANRADLVLACGTVMLTPTVNVQEIKRGEWMFKFYCGNMSGYDYGMSCSVCKKPTYRQFAEKMPNYCPNCGALMMDEVKE